MYILSCRRDFTNADAFLTDAGGRPYVAARYEGEARADYSAIVDHVRDQRVLFLVHGYNNTYDDLVGTYNTIMTRLHDVYSAVVGFAWPGGDSAHEWRAATDRTHLAAAMLARCLPELSHAAGSMDIMAHSLGCRVVLSMFNHTSAAKVGNLFLLAAAVDNESLEMGQPYYSATQLVANRLFVFYTTGDGVLERAYPLAELDCALGHRGPESRSRVPRSVSVVNCSDVIHSHNGYKDSNELYQFVRSVASGAWRARKSVRL